MKCFCCGFELQRDAITYLSHIKLLHPIPYSMMEGMLRTKNYDLDQVQKSMLIAQLEFPEEYKKASEVFCITMERFFESLNTKPSYVS